jgi:uncharacterized protein (TIGR03435 family)
MHGKLDSGRRPLLVSAAMAILATVIGLVSPPPAGAQAVDVVVTPRAGAAAPQAEATGPLSFEVASIKPSAGDGRTVMVQMAPGGRYTASGVTVKLLIQQAYDVRDFQISGGPSWLTSERYDIVAKAETNANRDQIKLMLQSLLKERFNLVLHRETRQLPIYALVVGKNGHKLHLSEIQPSEQPAAAPPNAPQSGPRVALGGVAQGGGAQAGRAGGVAGGIGGGAGGGGGAAGGPQRAGSMMRMGRGQLSAEMAPIAALVNMLSQQLGRPVLDQTGLTGSFDFKLEWTPDETQRGLGLEGEKPPGEIAPPGESGPSIFTAVQEQLGLKLESAKGPVEILVIDRIERPSEN